MVKWADATDGVRLPKTDEEMWNPPQTAPDRILRMCNAFKEAKALLSAVELDVFTALAEAPLDAGALRAKIKIHKRGARDFFDALVALGLLNRDRHGLYSNAADSERYLVRGGATYIGGLVNHFNTLGYPQWALLTRALQTGEAQFGTDGLYRDIYGDPAAVESFAQRMSGGTLPVATALAAKFPWAQFKTLMDIGCSQGCLLVTIAHSHPHIAGGGFDLPLLEPVFSRFVRESGLSDRLVFHGGDFLVDRLPSADVLVMGRVLHNWDLSTKHILLKKAFAALPSGGALIVYERLIDDERRTNAVGLLASLNMLLLTAGGFDYSAADCFAWMREAGFRDIRTEPLTVDQSMIVGMK